MYIDVIVFISYDPTVFNGLCELISLTKSALQVRKLLLINNNDTNNDKNYNNSKNIRIQGILTCLRLLLLFLSAVEKSMVICEGKRGSISCENGKIIQVLDANYGRLNKISCTHEKMGDINCGSNNSLKVVQDKCNHKSSCELHASNREFHGDPCGGTYKYLEVKYRCLE